MRQKPPGIPSHGRSRYAGTCSVRRSCIQDVSGESGQKHIGVQSISELRPVKKTVKKYKVFPAGSSV